jgi:hypothetical protein
MVKDHTAFLRRKLEDFSLEELFEYFDLEPVEVFILLHNNGYLDLDYYAEDETQEEDYLQDDQS